MKAWTPKILLATAALAGTSAVTLGCSADQSTGGRVAGEFATVYSSLPLQGPHAEQSASIVKAQKLALSQAGGRAGKFKINFAMSDDSSAKGVDGVPGWNPDKVAANARGAIQNSRTIAYIGEFDSSATAISLPITNGAGIVQVSPASSAVGLTRPGVGAEKGEADKYYPSGDQTFARVIPADDVQASAAARWAKRLGSKRVLLLGDKLVQGNGLAEQFGVEAKKLGLTIVDERTMDPRADDYTDLAEAIVEKAPDTVYFGGGQESNASQLWRELHAALPDARLMGSGGLLVPGFYRRLSPAQQRVTYLTSNVQDPQQLPATGKNFMRDYRREFHETPNPYAAYGYAAMQLVLSAIERAGDEADQRQKVVDAVIATGDLDSPIGRFSIDANGDTSLDRIAGYRLSGGRPVFTAPLRGDPSPDQPL